MPPGVAVEGGNPDQAVDADLCLEVAVGVLAGNGKGDPLDTGLVPCLVVGDVGLPPPALAVAEVHPEQHLRPVLGFGAAGAGVDGEKTVTPVMLPRKHL